VLTIKAKDLTKIYKLYDRPSSRLREIILRRPLHREFIALDKITFEVEKGESLGIIGENGAGKSTLLKILSKTLSPTYGEFEINGRVSSLLELGSGFHPEFTGIENIYFYGSLLGINKSSMQKKVDEIIEFSELGDFIHYPLKTYSSGMFVRLAFSVAMAVEPEILIIDEVLSVGDMHFQKKSTDRILEFKNSGRTVVFCSHSMYHINLLCDRVIWLKKGKIEMNGDPFDVVSAYESDQRAKDDAVISASLESDNPSLPVYIKDVRIMDGYKKKYNEPIKVKISVKSIEDIEYGLGISLRRNDHIVIYTASSLHDRINPFRGDREIIVEYPQPMLLAGTYYFVIYLMDRNQVNIYQEKISPEFKVIKESLEPGIFYLNHRWLDQTAS